MDPEWEAAEDEALERDEHMVGHGFRSAAWEVTRAELRDADEATLRSLARIVYGLDSEGMSRTKIIDYILSVKEAFRWGPP